MTQATEPGRTGTGDVTLYDRRGDDMVLSRTFDGDTAVHCCRCAASTPVEGVGVAAIQAAMRVHVCGVPVR